MKSTESEAGAYYWQAHRRGGSRGSNEPPLQVSGGGYS